MVSLTGVAIREPPELEVSHHPAPCQGFNMRSWFTSSLTEAPGRTVIVGWICKLCDVIWSPALDTFCSADCRNASTRSPRSLNCNSAPTPSIVESTTPLSNVQVWKSTWMLAPTLLA